MKDFFLRKGNDDSTCQAGVCADSVDELCSNCKAGRKSSPGFKLSEKQGHLEIAKTLGEEINCCQNHEHEYLTDGLIVRHLNSPSFRAAHLAESDDGTDEEDTDEEDSDEDADEEATDDTDIEFDSSSQKNGGFAKGTISSQAAALGCVDSTKGDAPSNISGENSNVSKPAENSGDISTAPKEQSSKPAAGSASGEAFQAPKDSGASSTDPANDEEAIAGSDAGRDDSDDASSVDPFADAEDDIDAEAFKKAERAVGDGWNSARESTRYEVSHWPYHLKEAEKLWTREEREASGDWAELWQALESFIFDTPKAWQNAYRELPESLLPWLEDDCLEPLPLAVALGSVSLTERCIRRGEQVGKLTRKGRAPLSLASGKGLDLLKLLLASGADPNQDSKDLYDSDVYCTPFSEILWSGPTIETIQLFLDHHGDPTIPDGFGRRGVHVLAWSYLGESSSKMLQLLLDNGEDVNALDNYGETPLHYLLQRSDLSLDHLKAFLSAGAQVNIDDNESQSKTGL